MVYSYGQVKSTFIKAKIKGRGWKSRQYVDELISIERAALGHMGGGWSTGMLLNQLEERYPKEWKAIHMELVPGEYKKRTKSENAKEEEERREMEEFEKQERAEQKKLKKEWLSMGGK
ncbi:MAG: hypothetical protein HY365_00690 [Candidatus Aenigmarchaeota archaeon]|nr:hypothetical protein [Candidatus Aenigmarchaeota archaeon]